MNVVPRTPAAYLCCYQTLISASLCAELLHYCVIWAHCFAVAATWSRSLFCYSGDLLWISPSLHQCDVHNLEPNTLPFSIHHSPYLYIHVHLVTFLIRPLTKSSTSWCVLVRLGTEPTWFGPDTWQYSYNNSPYFCYSKWYSNTCVNWTYIYFGCVKHLHNHHIFTCKMFFGCIWHNDSMKYVWYEYKPIRREL